MGHLSSRDIQDPCVVFQKPDCNGRVQSAEAFQQRQQQANSKACTQLRAPARIRLAGDYRLQPWCGRETFSRLVRASVDHHNSTSVECIVHNDRLLTFSHQGSLLIGGVPAWHREDLHPPFNDIRHDRQCIPYMPSTCPFFGGSNSGCPWMRHLFAPQQQWLSMVSPQLQLHR